MEKSLKWFAFAAFMTGCTGGQLIDGAGAPVTASTTVEIRACRVSASFRTTAEAGTFYFNPYDPYSSDFDFAQYVPEGPVLVILGGTHFYAFDHRFTRTCTIPRNNQPDAQLPCSKDMFVYDSLTASHPATGPDGQPIRDPNLVTGKCRYGDQLCLSYESQSRILIERYFLQRCLAGNIR